MDYVNTICTWFDDRRDTGKYVRELFGKKYGHKEWVSTCAYSNGKIISGAMDSVVCLWDSHGVRCDHFGGHS
jgi:WD40 repeat protein